MELTEKEKHLIEEIRKICYGRIVIIMQEGEPVRIEEGIASKKL